MARKKPSASAGLTRPPVDPFACTTTGCAGVLVPIDSRGNLVNLERDDAHAWRCSRGGGPGCGVIYSARGETEERERCPNDGAPLRFDPTIAGQTVGGLRLRGWMHCDHCAASWVTRRGVPDAGGGTSDGRWRIANGGASLDAGGVRLRAEGKTAREDVVTLMGRISRMPAFEAALERIASGELDAAAARAIALEALAIGENSDATTASGDGIEG